VRPALAAGMVWALALGGAAAAAARGQFTATGQSITPTAARGAVFQALNPDIAAMADYTAGQAAALALSPDGKTLLVLTSGFNRMFGADGKLIRDLSNEYVFVYDVSGATPVKRQVLSVPDTFLGLAWAPTGGTFYVSGGVDDVVLEYGVAPGGFVPQRRFPLGHEGQGLGLAVKPAVAGLAVSPDGRWLLAANIQNDSASLIDLANGHVSEQDLRPGAIDRNRAGEQGGAFPRAVVWASNTKAYVASQRDRQIVALSIDGGEITVGARIKTRGQPVALVMNPRANRLYAALDNTDGVAVIDTIRDRTIERIATAGPALALPAPARLGGAGSNALALSPNGRTLLVTNGGENALAVVRLDARAAGAALAPRAAKPDDDDDPPKRAVASAVVGLIPTGWYPTAVAVRPDGRRIFVVNGKSVPGANPRNCRNSLLTGPGDENACKAANQYVWQLEKAGFLSLPPPSPAELGRLTRQVAVNDHFPSAGGGEQDAATFAFLRQHIRHVIYIVKENRSYDQVLGDLEVGDGDPKLTVFGAAMTPNQHALARGFVDLDAFFDSGESSNTGWDWTTAARTNDYTERAAPVNYADRGLQYDQEGDNRNINVGFATPAERVAANPLIGKDPNLLPGTADVAAPDGPGGEEGRGYIWDSALRAGLKVRNWGFFGDLALYFPGAGPLRTPLEREPWKTGLKVFTPAKAALMNISDPYFRGFDQAFPDYWRFKEWEREFDGFVAKADAPALMLVRLPHDHTGAFGQGLDGVDTVETELADNDYAVGLVVDKVAKSPFAKDTLVFVVEDDAQDGPDHVDAHRSTLYIAGPYVRQKAVVSKRYTTVNLLRTIEDVLGIEPMGLPDALADPMGAVFDVNQAAWGFDAKVPAVLRSTKLPLPPQTGGQASAMTACLSASRRDGHWWAAAMAGQNFDVEDQLDTDAFNRALWRGLKGEAAAYPAVRDGRDLRHGRARLLKAAEIEGCGDKSAFRKNGTGLATRSRSDLLHREHDSTIR
jgi:DNA-binding beta-propeller fold protein YncE